MKKNRDYVYAVCLVVIHYVLWYYFAYVKYADVSPKDYKYILGMPEWFFYSSVVVSMLIIFTVIVVCNIIFNADIREEER